MEPVKGLVRLGLEVKGDRVVQKRVVLVEFVFALSVVTQLDIQLDSLATI